LPSVQKRVFDHLAIWAAYSPHRAHGRGRRAGSCHAFNLAELTRQRVTFGGVERYLAQLAAHPGHSGCGRCVLAPRVAAQRVYAIASGWQRQVRGTKVRAALIRSPA
jgi:hypothetical protein